LQQLQALQELDWKIEEPTGKIVLSGLLNIAQVFRKAGRCILSNVFLVSMRHVTKEFY